MILYGAGAHAKVVYDCMASKNIRLDGVFDDNPGIKLFMGNLVLSPYSSNAFINKKLIISIGSNNLRYKLARTVSHSFGHVVHKTAYIAGNSHIDEGTMILAKSLIQSSVEIGKHVIINSGAIVEHDCQINDVVHVGPGAVICGGASIGEGSLIGANATILPGLSIGAWSIIGAGSVVLDHVPDGTKVVGNPARIVTD